LKMDSTNTRVGQGTKHWTTRRRLWGTARKFQEKKENKLRLCRLTGKRLKGAKKKEGKNGAKIKNFLRRGASRPARAALQVLPKGKRDRGGWGRERGSEKSRPQTG